MNLLLQPPLLQSYRCANQTSGCDKFVHKFCRRIISSDFWRTHLCAITNSNASRIKRTKENTPRDADDIKIEENQFVRRFLSPIFPIPPSLTFCSYRLNESKSISRTYIIPINFHFPVCIHRSASVSGCHRVKIPSAKQRLESHHEITSFLAPKNQLNCITMLVGKFWSASKYSKRNPRSHVPTNFNFHAANTDDWSTFMIF